MRAKVNIISELTNISKKLSLCKKQKFQTTEYSIVWNFIFNDWRITCYL